MKKDATDSEDEVLAKAIIGTLPGAAARAAVTYATMRADVGDEEDREGVAVPAHPRHLDCFIVDGEFSMWVCPLQAVLFPVSSGSHY